MTDYRDYGFPDPTSTQFISCTKQICAEVDNFRQTNEKAIDRNTEMIRVQNVKNRKNFSDLFDRLRMSFFKIFTKNGLDSDNETFYNMVQKENDDTQAAIQAHQKDLSASLKDDASTIEEAIRENTSGDTANVGSLIESLNSLRLGQTEIKNAIGQIQRV